MRLSIWRIVLAAVPLSGWPLAAQDGTGNPPRIASSSRSPQETSALPPMARLISVSLRGVALRSALDTIAAHGGVDLSYSPESLQGEPRITVELHDVTVRRALEMVLRDTDLELFISSEGHAAVERRNASGASIVRSHAPGATLRGTISDASLHVPVAHAIVHVAGTTHGAQADADGRYVVSGLSAGTYQVTARRLGYQPSTQTARIPDDTASVTLDFVLVPTPTKLTEIVTTAVGDQRRYEVGNVISTINVDSLAPTTPVTSVTDVISARVPGADVLETSGRTGGGEAIRIRGVSSLVLQSDPIIIVDGIRVDNTAGGTVSEVGVVPGCSICTPRSVPSPSRINDIDFSDIESIDVLKGPAASTEYGTDAANGVIVIKTKHGTTGLPQWRGSAEETGSALPVSFPQLYHPWGHTTTGARTPVFCPVVPYAYNPEGGAYSVGAGTCAIDSVTSWDPLNHSSTSMYGTGFRQKYDLSVSGGSNAITYFGSAGLSNETGVEQMPPIFYNRAAALGLPGSVDHPNGEQQRSVRGNASAVLSPFVELSANAAYLSTYQTGPYAEADYEDVVAGAGIKDSVYGYPSGYQPLYDFGQPTSSQTDRFTGGLTATWHPTFWFTTHATVGIDHGSSSLQSETLPQVAFINSYYGTALQVGNTTTDIYTVDLRATATARLARTVRGVTSTGLQLTDNRTQGTNTLDKNITVENQTLNGAVNPIVTQLGERRATLGGYVEEQLGLADRLFLTGAVRVDAGSGFGYSYNTAVYPKASISWLALNQGPATVRLRGAYGQSGQQPPNGASLQLVTPSVVWLGGQQVSTVGIANAGNSVLQPERSAEYEGGFDVGLWQNRVSIDLTIYDKTTDRALVETGTGFDLGSYPFEENIGKVDNNGIELALSVTPIQTREVTWDLSVNGSINHNKLLSLAPGILSQTPVGAGTGINATRFVPGYALYSNWGLPYTYADLNHDGIIEPNEVTLGNNAVYAGPSQPTQELSVGSHLALWHGAVAIGALVDYRGGFRLLDEDRISEVVNYQTDVASVNPHASLAQQAEDVALIASEVGGAAFSVGTPVRAIEDASYVRFRELSLTYTIPAHLTRWARVRTLSLTAAVRNLWLWTRYGGIDPEVAGASGLSAQYQPTSNSYVYNHDVRSGSEETPLPRYVVFRLNIGF